MDTLYSIIRIIAFISVLFLLVYDLFIRKVINKKDLTPTNYIGIAVIIFFIIWPAINEASIGNLSFKKRIEKVESIVNDIFTRKQIKFWLSDKIEIFPVAKVGEYYNYEIQLADRPVVNTVELWVSKELMNPKFYTINYESKKITLRHKSPPDELKDIIKGGGEPLFTVQYIKE